MAKLRNKKLPPIKLNWFGFDADTLEMECGQSVASMTPNEQSKLWLMTFGELAFVKGATFPLVLMQMVINRLQELEVVLWEEIKRLE